MALKQQRVYKLLFFEENTLVGANVKCRAKLGTATHVVTALRHDRKA